MTFFSRIPAEIISVAVLIPLSFERIGSRAGAAAFSNPTFRKQVTVAYSYEYEYEYQFSKIR